MLHLEAFHEFRRGLVLLCDGDAAQALPFMQRAVELDGRNAYYISYLGLALGRAEQKWAEAEHHCTRALRLDPKQAQLYLNLADVYVAAGRQQDAADTLSRGLRYSPRDYRLNAALNRLAVRRPAVVRSLPRSHYVNRWLGKWRHEALRYIAEL